MKRALIVIGIAFAAACGGTERPPSTPSEAPSAQVISGRQARTLVARGAILLDVRSGIEYEIRHLDGARNIPVEELARRAEELPRDRPIVLYCFSGHRSENAGRILREAGFTHVYDVGSMMSY